MTQDEAWIHKFEQVREFILKNARNPSKYDAAERGQYLNWMKHNRKLYAAGLLKEDREEKFKNLLVLSEQYRHKNQYE